MSFFQAVTGARVPSTPSIITTDLSLHLNANDPASYPGSGTAWDDISVNENSVTLINGPTYSSNDGGYIEFDGVNDYGDEATATGSPFQMGTGVFSLEYWVRYDSNSVPQVVFDWRRRDTNASTNEGLVDSRATTLEWRYYYKTGFILTSTGTLANNVWHHVVLVREGTGTNQTKLYFNATLDSSHTWTQSFSSYGYFYIGRNIDNNRFLDGRIAQLRVYKGKALTASEVTNNWNATRALYGL